MTRRSARARWVGSWGLCGLLACGPAPGGHHEHDHGEHGDQEHGAQEQHGEHPHGHAALSATSVSDETELFVEFDPLVVGRASAFAVHLTDLPSYKPIADGTVAVVLSREDAVERFEAPVSDTPGIFRPSATPPSVGEYVVTVEWSHGERTASHRLGARTVYANPGAVPEPAEPPTQGHISLLKEQQWQLPFGVAAVTERPMHRTLRVFGKVEARPEGQALVTSPGHGRLVAGAALLSVGVSVGRDDRLAMLAPALENGGDVASLELAVARADAALRHQERELQRVRGLREQGAVSDRRVAEVELARDQAKAELSAGRRRASQFRRLQRPGAKGRGVDTVDVRAPIAGLLVDVRATPGAYVEDGQVLFRIVDPAALRVHAYVPEAELPRLDTVVGAWVWLEHGEGAARVLRLGREAVVTTAGPVDDATHAVEVLLSLPADAGARVGQSVDVQLIHGEADARVAVPADAVYWDAGVAQVFVMVGGETFERRVVVPGARDGDWVAVGGGGGGVAVGERVVIRGAELVAMAGAMRAAPTHAHPH